MSLGSTFYHFLINLCPCISRIFKDFQGFSKALSPSPAGLRHGLTLLAACPHPALLGEDLAQQVVALEPRVGQLNVFDLHRLGLLTSGTVASELFLSTQEATGSGRLAPLQGLA